MEDEPIAVNKLEPLLYVLNANAANLVFYMIVVDILQTEIKLMVTYI